MPRKTIIEFCDENGGLGYALSTGQLLYLFPTGARLQLMEGGNLNYGTMYEPSPDVEKRLGDQRQYWQAKLTQAEADFALVKDILQDRVRAKWDWNESLYGPVPGNPGAAWLARIKEVVKQLRNAVSDLDRKYNALPSVRRRQEIEAKRAREKAEIDLMLAEGRQAERDAIAAITLDD